MEQYRWRTGTGYKVKANIAYSELRRIEKKYKKLSPEFIVQESKEKKSVFHNIFEWNDSKAGVEYRKWQARQMVSRLEVVVVNTENLDADSSSVQVFSSISDDEGKKKYVDISDPNLDDSYWAEILKDIKVRIYYWRKKLDGYGKAKKIIKALDYLDSKISDC